MVQTYQPLYLKYRPQSLADLVGQKSVAQTLTNAIEHNRISHAYLFTGPRGTGKTSSARILAKSLNCEQGPTPTPCLVCSSCLEIKAGNSPSVFELDAASNNSVDDARSLIERAPLVAQGGRYKLYIIDECHMLTKEAFNALLKTIEEPPPMVVFILATTEEHKVPPTIISRCQRLMFKLVNQKELTAHLRSISTQEEINIQDEALELIARRSGGGLRDALGLLDQASLLSTKEKSVGVNDLLILLGAVHEDVLLQISGAIQNRDGHAVLTSANTLLMEGREPAVLVLELAKHFLNLTKASYINETGGVTVDSLTSLVLGSPSYLQAIVAQAKTFDRAELALMVEYLDKLEQSCRRSSQPVLSVEMGLLALCHRHDMTFVRDLDARVKTIESVLHDDIARGPATKTGGAAVAPTSKFEPPTSSNKPASSSGPSYGARPASTPQQIEHAPAAQHSPAAAQHSPAAAQHSPAAAQHTPSPAQHNIAATSQRSTGAETPHSAQNNTTSVATAESAAPPRPVPPAKLERSELPSATPAKAPAPSSSLSSRINEAMASAGLGAPSTTAFKSSGGGNGEQKKPSAFPQHASKVPLEISSDDSSYDDVEPEPGGRVASPVMLPPIVEPTLEELEAQPEVVEEIDEYDIVPRSTQPATADVVQFPSSPSQDSEESEDDDEDEQPAELPIASDDEDADDVSPAQTAESPTSPTLAAASSESASSGSDASGSGSAGSTSGSAASGSAVDIDEFWSDVKESLQKRHLPTFSIVSVHAFPVSFENNTDFVIGVRNETFQKQLDNKIEHLKAACAAVAGRDIFVRVKVIADNTPKPAMGAGKGPQSSARPKETRSAPTPSEEGESRPQQSPQQSSQQFPSPSRSALNPPPPSVPSLPATNSSADGAGPVRTSAMTHIETRVGGSLINEAYKLFEGPGSRLIG